MRKNNKVVERSSIWIIKAMNIPFFEILTGNRKEKRKIYSSNLGWFKSCEEACHVVKENYNEIGEGGTNDYVVVYPSKEGIWNSCLDFSQEIWFKYNKTNNKFDQIPLPGRKDVALGC